MTVHMKPASPENGPGQHGSAQKGSRLGFRAMLHWRGWPRWVWAIVAAAILLFIWYGVIGAMQARIAPDPALRPTAAQLPSGGSVAVGFSARLVDVEVNDRSFTPNNPFYFPTGFAKRAPAYQVAVTATVAAFVDALSMKPDSPALAEAAALLQTSPTQRWWQLGWPPVQPSAERTYRAAVDAMVRHNQDQSARYALIPSTGSTERLPPHARAGLAALADSLEAQAMRGDAVLAGRSDRAVGVEFSAARGTAHASAMLIRGLRDDHAAAIRLSGRAAYWGETLDHLDRAAVASPLFISQNDLTVAGYQMLMASSAIRRILE